MTQNQIGFNTTSSSPFVAPGDVIYFRGTDDRLLRINSDGSDSYPIGGNHTSSSPFAFSDPLDGEWVYFRGTGDELWKVRGDSDGTDLTRIGGNSTSSTPFVTFDATAQEVHVYFQGTDNRLLRVNGDGSGGIQIGTNTTELIALRLRRSRGRDGMGVLPRHRSRAVVESQGRQCRHGPHPDRDEHHKLDAVRYSRCQHE